LLHQQQEVLVVVELGQHLLRLNLVLLEHLGKAILAELGRLMWVVVEAALERWVAMEQAVHQEETAEMELPRLLLVHL